MSFSARALLFLVRVYQAFFSALMPSACKFYPSCSHYAAEAVAIHGARRGSWLALRRIGRCHPFSRGGVDLVPGAAEVLSGAGIDLRDSVDAKLQESQAETGATEVQTPQAEAFATSERITTEEVHS